MKKTIFGHYTSIIDRLVGIQVEHEQVIQDDNAQPIAAPPIPEEPAAPAEPVAVPLEELAVPAEQMIPAAQLQPAALEVDMGPYADEGKEEDPDLEQEEEEAEGAEEDDDDCNDGDSDSEDDDDYEYDDDEAEQANDKHDKDKDNDEKGARGGGATGASGGSDTDSTGPSGGGEGSGGSSGSSSNSHTDNDGSTDGRKHDVNKLASYNTTSYGTAGADEKLPMFIESEKATNSSVIYEAANKSFDDNSLIIIQPTGGIMSETQPLGEIPISVMLKIASYYLM